MKWFWILLLATGAMAQGIIREEIDSSYYSVPIMPDPIGTTLEPTPIPYIKSIDTVFAFERIDTVWGERVPVYLTRDEIKTLQGIIEWWKMQQTFALPYYIDTGSFYDTMILRSDSESVW